MIFVDTSFFHALFGENDQNYARADEALEDFKGRHLPDLFITTDLVVLETITLTRRRQTHSTTVFVGDHLFSEKSARIYRTSFDEHREAFEILRKHKDKRTMRLTERLRRR